MSIEIKNLTKRYGDKLAVDNVSFSVPDGKVTGFIGPNGAGKTTTMRSVLGLDVPTSGEALVDGEKYASLKNPLASVGALIDAKAFHKARSPRQDLEIIAKAAGLPKSRVDEVINLAGLDKVANKDVGKFSLGMAQRVGIAVAMLGDPKNLVLDEPVNGLDPEGVVWVRNLCKSFAAQGKAVLISSHLMSELSHTVDNVVIIGQGKVLETGTLDEIVQRSGEPDLETAFLKLTASSVEYRAGELPPYGSINESGLPTAAPVSETNQEGDK
jgi:ABC-2 type transport system ATP-binding protein